MGNERTTIRGAGRTCRGMIAGMVVVLAGVALVLGGCVSALDRNRATLESMYAAGDYQTAARMLDDPAVKETYAPNSKLLYWLDRGALALAVDDTGTAIELLEKAESSMEADREPSGGEELGRWLLNDTVTNYYGRPYEEIYVNTLKLLAQLEKGQIEGGATVEARRAAGKADVLRDRYVRGVEGVRERGGSELAGLMGRTKYANETAGGEFIESTLATYLTAVTFMKTGDSGMQSVAGRRLQSAIELQRPLQRGGQIDAAAFAGVGEMRSDEANVLLVGVSGRGPTLVANRIGPIPVYEWPVYFELPELAGGSSEVGGVRVVIEGLSAGAESRTVQLGFIEDFRAVATENHRREMPLIYARTLLRSQLKAAAAFAATQAVKNSQKRGSNRDLAQVGMIIAGLAFVGLTEKADLRCWTMMPGRADVGLVKLAPGNYRVVTEYLSRNGGVGYRTAPREITVSGGRNELVTVVEHYWR